MYDIKKIYEAYSVDEAIKLKLEHPEAKFIAGGSDVLVKTREGRMAGEELISIYLIDDLRKITLEDNGDLRVGALCSFTNITNNELVKKYAPLLGEAVDTAGGPQLRNIATIGGNVCNGAPSADSAPSLFAFDAIIELQGPEGIRHCHIEDLYQGFGKLDIREGEIMTAAIITKENYEGYYGHYFKYTMRKAMDIATSSCAISLKFTDSNKVENVRAAYGVASVVPIRAKSAEEFLIGKELTDENITLFAKKALDDLSPRDSWRASKALRRQILFEIARRDLVDIREKRGI